MIYEFFNESNIDLLIKYFTDIQKMNVEFIDYNIVDNIKHIQFGYKGNKFKLIVDKDSDVKISSIDDMPFSGEFHHLRVMYSGSRNSKSMQMKSDIIMYIRDFNLNKIL